MSRSVNLYVSSNILSSQRCRHQSELSGRFECLGLLVLRYGALGCKRHTGQSMQLAKPLIESRQWFVYIDASNAGHQVWQREIIGRFRVSGKDK